MLGRSHRFHGYNSLRSVYKYGQNLRGTGVTLRFHNRGANKPYRVAVVVSRKVSKSAVTRNRIRRRIYELVRLNDQAIAPGSDLIFTVHSDQLAETEAGKLELTIKSLLQKTAA